MTRAVRDFLTNLDATGALDRGGIIVTLTHDDAQHIAQNIREGGGIALRRRWTVVPIRSVDQCVKLEGASKPILLAPAFAHAPDPVRERVLTMAAQVRAMLSVTKPQAA